MRHGDGSVFQEWIDIANYVIVKKLVMNFIIGVLSASFDVFSGHLLKLLNGFYKRVKRSY